MTSMQQVPAHRRVVVGVDTHKYVHVAVAIDELGTVLDARSFSADSGGYTQLLDWAASLGGRLTFAIEGTGSYGAGLTSAVRRRDIGAIEVMRTDRRDRRLRGKSDTLDAENAARAVLAGNATAIPKSADGTPRRRCSSSPATTPTGSVPSRRSPGSAGLLPSRHPQG
jgi:transposase